ncbi:MAG: serine/threonine protein phosphatase [Chitinophagaceae bacterium]|nr:MAG: serine/threonine protein phosphatase [Chitinophagaceae bacterium]
MQRTIVIGDIHGALKALNGLMSEIKPTTDDLFIFLGDYVDGWPDSAQVVEFLLDFRNTNKCRFIRGNHDVWCENWLNGAKAEPIWLQHGGKATIESYQNLPDDHKPDHRDFFAALENYIIDDQNRLFIHAGFSSMDGPAGEFKNGMYSWDRSLWEQALKLEQTSALEPGGFPEKYKLFNEVFIGHTPTIFYQIDTPFKALNVINIDTGAGFNGKLSAMDINDNSLWQSKPVPELYPGIKGRAY